MKRTKMMVTCGVGSAVFLLLLVASAVAWANPPKAVAPIFQEGARWHFEGKMETSNCVGPIEGWVCDDVCCSLEEAFEMRCRVVEVQSTKGTWMSRIACVGAPTSVIGRTPADLVAGCWRFDKKGLHHLAECGALDEEATKALTAAPLLLPNKLKKRDWPKCKDPNECQRSRLLQESGQWCFEEEMAGGDSLLERRCFVDDKAVSEGSFDFGGGTSSKASFSLREFTPPKK